MIKQSKFRLFLEVVGALLLIAIYSMNTTFIKIAAIAAGITLFILLFRMIMNPEQFDNVKK